MRAEDDDRRDNGDGGETRGRESRERRAHRRNDGAKAGHGHESLHGAGGQPRVGNEATAENKRKSIEDMTPEQRQQLKQRWKNATPEQREKMRKRMQERGAT